GRDGDRRLFWTWLGLDGLVLPPALSSSALSTPLTRVPGSKQHRKPGRRTTEGVVLALSTSKRWIQSHDKYATARKVHADNPRHGASSQTASKTRSRAGAEQPAPAACSERWAVL
ncbi:hypothetical protein V8D89_010003, partial [Ganoderma adspersum]